MADRQFFYNEDLDEGMTNSTSQTLQFQLKFDPDPNAVYLLLGNYLLKSSSTARVTGFLSTWDGSTYNNRRVLELQPRASSTKRPVTGASIYEASANPPTQYQWQNGLMASSTSVYASKFDARLCALKLLANDKYVHNVSDTTTTTTSTSYVNVDELTFTPPTAGDYLIIASARLWGSNTGAIHSMCLDVNGSEFCEISVRPVYTLSSLSFFAIHKASFTAAEQNVRIKFKTNNAASAGRTSHWTIAALRLSDFDASDYTADDTRSTVASADLQTKLTLSSLTLDSNYWLVLTSAVVDMDSTSSDRRGATRIGTSAKLIDIERPDNTAADGHKAPHSCILVNSTPTADKVNLAYSSASGDTTAGMAHARIAALRLASVTKFIPQITFLD